MPKPRAPPLARAATPPRPKSLQAPTSPVSPISPWPPVDIDEAQPQEGSTSAEAVGVVLHGDGRSASDALPSAKEIYGFIAALLTYFAFILYLVWAILPGSWLESVGWTWYPDKEWALIVPCYLMLIVLLAYLSYAALTAYNTPNTDSLSLLTDTYSHIPVLGEGEEPYYWKFADPNCIPDAVDLPIQIVNRVLYPPRKRRRKIA